MMKLVQIQFFPPPEFFNGSNTSPWFTLFSNHSFYWLRPAKIIYLFLDSANIIPFLDSFYLFLSLSWHTLFLATVGFFCYLALSSMSTSVRGSFDLWPLKYSTCYLVSISSAHLSLSEIPLFSTLSSFPQYHVNIIIERMFCSPVLFGMICEKICTYSRLELFE
jgi:hypothetical protein